MKLYRIAAPFLLLALPLAACGGGDDDDATTSGGDSPPAELTALAGGGGGNSSAKDAAVNAKIAGLDVCPMLTDAEASEVAKNASLAGNGVTTTYNVTREPSKYTAEQQKIRTRASCRFLIEGASGGLAVVEVVVSPADDYDSLFKPGATPIPGIGDDAVSNAGTIYVKVGDMMISAGESSVTSSFTTEIFRRIAPDLK